MVPKSSIMVRLAHSQRVNLTGKRYAPIVAKRLPSSYCRQQTDCRLLFDPCGPRVIIVNNSDSPRMIAGWWVFDCRALHVGILTRPSHSCILHLNGSPGLIEFLILVAALHTNRPTPTCAIVPRDFSPQQAPNAKPINSDRQSAISIKYSSAIITSLYFISIRTLP